jgi:hypothetical protein
MNYEWAAFLPPLKAKGFLPPLFDNSNGLLFFRMVSGLVTHHFQMLVVPNISGKHCS